MDSLNKQQLIGVKIKLLQEVMKRKVVKKEVTKMEVVRKEVVDNLPLLIDYHHLEEMNHNIDQVLHINPTLTIILDLIITILLLQIIIPNLIIVALTIGLLIVLEII